MIASFSNAQPLAGFMGGLLIGLSAAIMLLGIGQIAGISGILARSALLTQSRMPWTLATGFICALVVGAALFDQQFGPIEANFPPESAWLITGGLCVGFGTRLSNGCTSGHGVCGISRLSFRSIVATITFMLSGIITIATVNIFTGGW